MYPTNPREQAMSTITINATVETAVKTMLNKHAVETIRALAEKYEFDAEEAIADLDLSSTRVTKSAAKEAKEPTAAKAAKVTKATKATKSKSEEPKEAKEKKPRKPSGYQAFSKAMREEVKGELGAMSMEELQVELELDEEPEKFNAGKHVMTALGKRWKALDDEEKEEWNEQASSAASDEEKE